MARHNRTHLNRWGLWDLELDFIQVLTVDYFTCFQACYDQRYQS